MNDTSALVERAEAQLRGEMRLRREDCYALLDCIRAQAKALARRDRVVEAAKLIRGLDGGRVELRDALAALAREAKLT